MRAFCDRRDGKRTEGYARLYGERWSLRSEWNLWARFCALSLERNSEGARTVWLAFPPVALWLTLHWGFRRAEPRELSLRVFDWAIWWRTWSDPNGWDSRRPRWREGCWHPIDMLLGPVKYTTEDLETRQIAIPMPEGEYPATAVRQRCTWKRPRWFARTREFVNVDIRTRGGIPHQGKGENSWDCGTDGLCGYSTEGGSFESAIIDGVARALRSRAKYDGSARAKYPAPAGEGAR
jgi:hypothetical protein